MKWFLKASLVALAAALLSGQDVTTGDKMHLRLRAIGERLKCQCGCNYTVGSCNMLNCHFRAEVYDTIRPDVASGVNEETILAKLKDKYGTIILASPPAQGFTLVGWIMPFAALVLGLYAVRFFLIRWRRARRPLAPAGPVVDKYRDQMEKELADLE